MKKSFILILYKVLIAYSVFYEIINNLLMRSILNGIYIAFFLLFSYSFFIRGCKFIFFNRAVCIFYVYVLFAGLFSISGFFERGWYGFTLYKQLYLFPMMTALFYCYPRITGETYKTLFTFLAKCTIAFVIVNSLLYFIEFPIWTRFHVWLGRISLGYPTIDAPMLILGLSVLLFYRDLDMSVLVKYFGVLIVGLGILSFSSGTGIFLLFLQLILFVVYMFFMQNNFLILEKVSFVILIVLIYILTSFTIEWFKSNDEKLYIAFTTNVDNKINSLLGNDEDVNSDSMGEREYQMKKAQKNFLENKPLARLFGIGFSRLNLDISRVKRTSDQVTIEYQYGNNLIALGVIGSFLWILCLISFLIASVKKSCINICFLSSLLCIIAASFTSCPLFHYGLSTIWALFCADLKYSIKKNVIK